jgi:arylsulfatase
MDTGSPASPDYRAGENRFSGEIEWVQIEIGADGHDHLIQPKDRLNIAMARQ